MFDDMSDKVGVFDFDELANHLLEQGLDTSPSSLHGCLTGLLAAGAAPQAELGLDALAQAMEVNVHGELADQLMQLYAVTAAALIDDEFTFHPLMPDDEVEIMLRTEAMALWCKGFLAGFAQISAAADKPPASLSKDSSEILKDIAAMAEAEVGAAENEDEEEDLENSYMELVEYLRFAVLNVFMDCGVQPEDPAEPEPEPQLH